MKCLSKPSGFFRRKGPLGLPQTSQVQSPLTPQNPRAKLKIVNDLIRRSISSVGKPEDESKKAPSEATSVADECTVADSFSDITRENEWYYLRVEKGLPTARSSHAAVASKENVYVVGGASVEGQLSDVQVFNMDAFSWKELRPAPPEAVDFESTELEVIPRSGSLIPQSGSFMPRGPRLLAPFAVIWKGRLIVVGCDTSAPSNSPVSVHAFDLAQSTWSVLKPSGDTPEARSGYRIAHVKSRLVMFGGEDGTGRIVDDVFAFDLDKITWKHLQTSGMKPAPRRNPAMACYAGHYIWIYGGKSYATYYNDMYCLDLKQLMWTKVKPTGVVPTVPRAGHVGIMREDSFYIVGGENRGDEMVDSLVFDMAKRSWSVVTRVHNMSPLAHNGLSVLKINHDGREYLLAFGGHGILLSCKMYALLLPSVNIVAGRNSTSSVESLGLAGALMGLTGASKRSTTSSQDKTSPTDPFQFHHTPSLSSSSWEADSPAPATESCRDLSVVESSVSSHKERPRVKTKSMSDNFDFDPSMPWETTPQHEDVKIPLSRELRQSSRLSNRSLPDQSPGSMGSEKHVMIPLSGELYQPSRLNFPRHDRSPLRLRDNMSPLRRREQSPFRRAAGKCEDDSLPSEEDSQIGTLIGALTAKIGDSDAGWGLRVLEAQGQSRRHCQSPQSDSYKAGQKLSRPIPLRKVKVETDVVNKQLKVVVKAIKELQEAQKSNIAKCEDLNMALMTIKELQGEVHELRKNKEDEEKVMLQKMMDIKFMIEQQHRRDCTAAENDHRMEAERCLRESDFDQAKLAGKPMAAEGG